VKFHLEDASTFYLNDASTPPFKLVAQYHLATETTLRDVTTPGVFNQSASEFTSFSSRSSATGMGKATHP